MASIFKRGSRKLSRSQLRNEPYYIEYTDEHGKTRRKKGFTDKEATERLASQLRLAVDQRRSGLVDPMMQRLNEHNRRPLSEHTSDFTAALKGGTNSKKHIRLTIKRIDTVIVKGGFATIADVDGPAVEACLHRLRTEMNFGPKTYNHYLQAFDQFCRWLVKSNRLASNPIAGLRRMNPDIDIRHKRRSLTPAEIARLIRAAQTSRKNVQGYTGELRARCYLVSYMTGLRQREMASLTPTSFQFESRPPTLTVEAACSKRRREDTIPLRPELIDVLAPWLETLAPDEHIFPRFERKKAWLMVKKDLEAAGIPYCTAEGVADFHAAGRASHITEMLRSGAGLVQVMKQARHSDVRLTLRYFKGNLGDQVRAVEKLPLPSEAGQEIVSDLCGTEGLWKAPVGIHPNSDTDQAATTNPLRAEDCDTSCPGVTSEGTRTKSGSGGNRTRMRFQRNRRSYR